MSAAVIDASALLALLDDEPGADRVAAPLTGASINAVNLAEVLGRLRRRGVSSEASTKAVDCLGLEAASAGHHGRPRLAAPKCRRAHRRHPMKATR